MKNFDWGDYLDQSDSHKEWFRNTIQREFFDTEKNIYERFFEVEENDIVMDVGASIGPFSYLLKDKNISYLYCIEPSKVQLSPLVNNISSMPFTVIPYAIGDSDLIKIDLGFYGESIIAEVKAMSFKEIIKKYNINKIDFLKTDCEGGEYNIFSIENICWLKENMKKCAGEWHLDTTESKQKFREFRDVFLRVFPKYRIYSTPDGVDISWDVWNEHFINYYTEVIIYIDNR